MAYMTRQQRAVLECMTRRQGGCATAAELTEELHRQGQNVGLTTVYRQLDKLSGQGLVHKIVTDEGAHYQYCNCREKHRDCFLLKCENCGSIRHLDCSHLGELYEHLLAEHGFTINPHRTLFYGLCEQCGKEGQA